jgi:hypothetical protein
MINTEKFFICGYNASVNDIFNRGNNVFLVSKNKNDNGCYTVITNAEYCNNGLNNSSICIVGDISSKRIEVVLRNNWQFIMELNCSVKDFLGYPMGVQIKLLLEGGIEKYSFIDSFELTKEETIEFINNF